MKVNMGSLDRILRVVAGLVIICVGFAFKSWWGAIGVVLVATAGIGFCPLYTLLGVSTCKLKAKPGGPA